MRRAIREQLADASREFGVWLGPALGVGFTVAAITLALGQHLIPNVWLRGAVVAAAGTLSFAAHAHYRLVALTTDQEVPIDVK